MTRPQLAAASTLVLTLLVHLPAQAFAQDARDDRVRIRVESAQPGLRLYYAHDQRRGRTLCTTPCELRLRRGFHDFAVGPDRGRSIPVPIVSLEADAVLDLAYDSHATARALGGVFSALGIVVGLLGGIGGVLMLGDVETGGYGAVFLGAGSGVLALGIVGAVAFGSWGDSARIEIRY